MSRTARDTLHALILVLADLAAAALAVATAFTLAALLSEFLGTGPYVSWDKAIGERLPVMVPLLLAVGTWLHGRGRYARRQAFWSETKDLLSACLLGFVVEGFIQYAVKEHVSRLWIAGSWCLIPVWAGILRAWMKGCLCVLGVRLVPVLVVGEGRASVAGAIASEPSIGWRVLPHDPEMSADAILAAAMDGGARHVVVVGQPVGPVIDVLRHLSSMRMPYSLCLPVAGSGLASMRPDAIVGHDFVLMGERPGLASPLSRASKRISDIVLALAIATVSLPVALATAAAVALDGGPILYAQERVGRGGRTFRCLKFRTMVVDSKSRLESLLASDPEARAEWDRDQKLRRDPRVTGPGRFLRTMALDEWPQLINVLRGDMSFVGPRPVTELELPRYGIDLPAYLDVRPGLTGLWQASGRNDVSYERRVALDAWYVRNWSAWLDVVVVMKTVPALLWRRGAY